MALYGVSVPSVRRNRDASIVDADRRPRRSQATSQRQATGDRGSSRGRPSGWPSGWPSAEQPRRLANRHPTRGHPKFGWQVGGCRDFKLIGLRFISDAARCAAEVRDELPPVPRSFSLTFHGSASPLPVTHRNFWTLKPQQSFHLLTALLSLDFSARLTCFCD